MPRNDGRQLNEPRPLAFQRAFTSSAPGSVLASFGATRVLCTATYTDGVPPFLQGKGQGWLTAEYGMLPASTKERKQRDRGTKIDGRGIEIQRLIGRAVRGVVDLRKLTERTIWIDCDVLQADGGTRTAAISGAYVALVDLLKHMERQRVLRAWPLVAQIAAVSVGIVNGEPVVDLDYVEDSKAEVDMNLVMLGDGRYVEIQGCAEARAFDRAQLDRMLALGEGALREIMGAQREALEAAVAG